MALQLRLRRDNLRLRIPGSLLGLALLAFGLFALLQAPAAPDPDMATRAVGYGLTLAVAGIAAALVSWLAPDLSGIWCNSPRYFGRRRPGE